MRRHASVFVNGGDEQTVPGFEPLYVRTWRRTTYPNVAVHNEADTQDAVKKSIVGAARYKSGDGEGYETSRE